MSSRSLTDAIKEDHQEVRDSFHGWKTYAEVPPQMYEYYEKYTQASGDADAQERWARQLIWEVARHAVGEVRRTTTLHSLELIPS